MLTFVINSLTDIWNTLFPAGVVTFIFLSLLGIATFCANRFAWDICLLPALKKKCKPNLFFDNNQETLTLYKVSDPQIEERVNKMVSEELVNCPSFDTTPIDPFQNLLGSMSNSTIPLRKRYNKDLEAYISSFKKHHTTVLQSDFMDKCMQPIQLLLKNEGKAACGNLDLEIEILQYEYCYYENARTIKVDQFYHRPVYFGDNMIMPIPMKTEDYDYSSWDLNEHIPLKIHYNFTHLNQGISISDNIPLIFVDTSKVSEIDINWKITEGSLSKPFTGKLKVQVK